MFCEQIEHETLHIHTQGSALNLGFCLLVLHSGKVEIVFAIQISSPSRLLNPSEKIFVKIETIWNWRKLILYFSLAKDKDKLDFFSLQKDVKKKHVALGHMKKTKQERNENEIIETHAHETRGESSFGKLKTHYSLFCCLYVQTGGKNKQTRGENT